MGNYTEMLIDLTIEDSFPASDPPFWTSTIASAGCPVPVGPAQGRARPLAARHEDLRLKRRMRFLDEVCVGIYRAIKTMSIWRELRSQARNLLAGERASNSAKESSINVASVMVRSVLTCRPQDSLSDAAKIMWENDCGSVPIVDNEGRAVGMVTDRDICMAAYTRDQPLSRMAVSSVSSRALVAVHESDPIEAAERLMQRHQVRRLPVTDPTGRPVGMLSLSDLARNATNGARSGLDAEGVVLTLAAIGKPRTTATQG